MAIVVLRLGMGGSHIDLQVLDSSDNDPIIIPKNPVLVPTCPGQRNQELSPKEGAVMDAGTAPFPTVCSPY